MNLVRCHTFDGQPVEFVDSIIGLGSMKDLYFSPDKSYVVAFFTTKQDAQAKDRLQKITVNERYGQVNQVGGGYWNGDFCWPTALLEHDGRLGIVMPTYSKHFFMEHGSKNNDSLGFKGKLKESKLFLSVIARRIPYLTASALRY